MNKKELLQETKAELIERARELDLAGRTKMSKDELANEIAKVLSRVEAARTRRARNVISASVKANSSLSTKARRAIEERSKRLKLEREEENKSIKKQKTSSDSGVRPIRAAKKKSPPPGLESLDLEAPSSISVPAPPKEIKKREAYAPLVPEDHVAGGPLPQKYGKNKFVLLTRDPRWLFAYWELLPVTEEKVIRDAGDDLAGEGVRKVLRIYDIQSEKSGDDEYSGSFDLMIHPNAKSWYIHLPAAGKKWKVDLGYIGKSGKFYKILGSKVVVTPKKSVSNVVDEVYRTLDEEFDEIFKLSGGKLIGEGVQSIGGSAIPKGKRRKVTEEEEERWNWPFPTSGGIWSGLPYSSGISAQLQPPVKKDNFFFWLNCDLILYGGTQPTAKVTVQGEPIKLRQDGTFTLRYALPDGKIVLPVVAIRADGKEKRKATPIVTRKTKR